MLALIDLFLKQLQPFLNLPSCISSTRFFKFSLCWFWSNGCSIFLGWNKPSFPCGGWGIAIVFWESFVFTFLFQRWCFGPRFIKRKFFSSTSDSVSMYSFSTVCHRFAFLEIKLTRTFCISGKREKNTWSVSRIGR